MPEAKTIEIAAKPFFELLKERDTSMWAVFAEMIDASQEQLVIFNDETGKEIAHYTLPTTTEQLEEDQKTFAAYFKERLQTLLQ